MLSWSGAEQGVKVDLGAIREANSGVDVQFANELLEFATAATELDEKSLDAKREKLVRAAGTAFTVDAAAVVANFEMMTRLADSSGASMPDELVIKRLAAAKAMGVDQVVSRRYPQTLPSSGTTRSVK